MKDLKKSLEDSIEGNELVDIGIDITEVAVDQLFEGGIIRDLPIISTVVGLLKVGKNIRDIIYLKKIILFIKEIQMMSQEKRIVFLKDISNIEKDKNRLFEKILLTLDRFDDSEKASLLGKVFKHLIVGNINLIQYYRIAGVIETMMLDEINYFFYAYGYYEYNDEIREKRHYYMDLIREDDLKLTMIRVGLFEVTEELVFSESNRPQQYKIKKKERLTRLGELFAEFGFGGVRYLKIPIE